MSHKEKITTIVSELLKGGYMRKSISFSEVVTYRVYDKKGLIIAVYAASVVDKIFKQYDPSVLDRQNDGKVKIVRRSLQQLDGRATAKKVYKKFIKSKHN